MESNESNAAGTAPVKTGVAAEACRVETEAMAQASEAHALQCEVRQETALTTLTFAGLLQRCKDMQLSIALMLNEADVEGDVTQLEELRVAMGAIAASLRARIEAGRPGPAPQEPPAAPEEPPVPPRGGGRGRR